MLEVYTHESLNTKPGAITADEHGGSARLAALGEKVLESAVMTNLFRRRPMHTAIQLKVTHLSMSVMFRSLRCVAGRNWWQTTLPRPTSINGQPPTASETRSGVLQELFRDSRMQM